MGKKKTHRNQIKGTKEKEDLHPGIEIEEEAKRDKKIKVRNTIKRKKENMIPDPNQEVDRGLNLEFQPRRKNEKTN